MVKPQIQSLSYLVSLKDHITKTCPCYLEPHFYIEKLGYAGVDLFFLFLLQNIDCGYSMRRFYRVPTIYVLSINKKNTKIFPLKFSIFTAEKILCVLHGQVFVMSLGTGPFLDLYK